MENRPLLGGIYFITDVSRRDNTYPPIYFYFFGDGSTSASFSKGVSNISEEKFWDNPEVFLAGMKVNIRDPGHFIVRGDRIIIEVFDNSPGDFFSENIVRYEGLITSDSSFILTKKICHWCIKHIPNYPKNDTAVVNVSYKFYVHANKPNPDEMWFKSKKWYRKNAWIPN